jgi:TonB family protein
VNLDSFTPIEQIENVQEHVKLLRQAVIQARDVAESNLVRNGPTASDSPSNAQLILDVERILDLLELHLQSERNLLHDLSTHVPLLRSIARDLDSSASLNSPHSEESWLKDASVASADANSPAPTAALSSPDVVDEGAKKDRAEFAAPLFGISLPEAEKAFLASKGAPSSEQVLFKRWMQRTGITLASYVRNANFRTAGVVAALVCVSVAAIVIAPRLLRGIDVGAAFKPTSVELSPPASAERVSSEFPSRQGTNQPKLEAKTSAPVHTPPKVSQSNKRKPATAQSSATYNRRNAPAQLQPEDTQKLSSLTAIASTQMKPYTPKLELPTSVPPQLLSSVEAVYPAFARQSKIEGDVQLMIRISESGSVDDVTAIRGPAALIPAAADAVRKWKYRPQSLNGRPVEADSTVVLRFRLN